MSGDIVHLRKLTKLTELRLSLTGTYGSVMNLSNMTNLTTLSIQFTAISGNLYKLWQTIGSKCTIWYCLPIFWYYNEDDTEYTRVQYNGYQNYNSQLNYSNSYSLVNSGMGGDRNSATYPSNSKLLYYNCHNTTQYKTVCHHRQTV